jgi:probable HAF family extracellular repeat protein
MTELGVLPGFEESAAYDVNDAGQIVGISVRSTSAHAFYWTPVAGMIDLGTLPGFDSSIGWRVNAGGQVVGTSSSRGLRAFSWTARNGMIDLGSLGGFGSSAQHVNATGRLWVRVAHSLVHGTRLYGRRQAEWLISALSAEAAARLRP